MSLKRIEVTNHAFYNRNKESFRILRSFLTKKNLRIFTFGLVQFFFCFEHVKIAIYEYFRVIDWKLQIQGKQNQNSQGAVLLGMTQGLENSNCFFSSMTG